MMLQISIARCQIEAEIHNIPMMYMIIFFLFGMRMLHNSSSLLLNLHCPHHNICNGQIKHGPFLSSVALPILLSCLSLVIQNLNSRSLGSQNPSSALGFLGICWLVISVGLLGCGSDYMSSRCWCWSPGTQSVGVVRCL